MCNYQTLIEFEDRNSCSDMIAIAFVIIPKATEKRSNFKLN